MSALGAIGNYRPCGIDNRSGDMEPGAYHITNAINENTTPEEFDEIVKNYPGYQLRRGGRCGINVLHSATYKGNLELVKHIIKIADENLINFGDGFGRTPLNFVTLCNNPEKAVLIAKEFIKHGADVNMATCLASPGAPHAATPLWIAAGKRDNIKLVQLLLKNGAVVNPNSLSTERQEILEEAKEEIEQAKETFFEFLACRRELEKNDPRYDMVPQETLLQIYQEYYGID